VGDPLGHIRLDLVALPDQRPVAVRVRLALKHLLRAQKLKCVRLDGVADGEEPTCSDSKGKDS
jgi:hypothetical protein